MLLNQLYSHIFMARLEVSAGSTPDRSLTRMICADVPLPAACESALVTIVTATAAAVTKTWVTLRLFILSSVPRCRDFIFTNVLTI